MKAWRICRDTYKSTAFDGTGAALAGGRWNSPGHRVVYTADSRASAILELTVHTDADVLRLRYVLIPIEFDVPVEVANISKFPRNWESDSHFQSRLGDEWVRSCRTSVLQVPSVIVPGEVNYLLNPLHPEFAKIKIGKPLAVTPDPRLKQ